MRWLIQINRSGNNVVSFLNILDNVLGNFIVIIFIWIGKSIEIGTFEFRILFFNFRL